MLKKLWIIVSILMAGAAGLFLYEGGKLLLWYHDRRLGILILAAGALETGCFIWSFRESLRIRPYVRHKIKRILAAYTAFSMGLSGFVVYCMRFYSLQTIVICAGAVFAAHLLLFLVIQWIAAFTHLSERDFQKQVQRQSADWELYGYAAWDEESVKLTADMAEAKDNVLIGSGFIFSLCIATILKMPQLRLWTLILLFIELAGMYSLKVFLAVEAARQAAAALDRGRDQSVLGFFTKYYENARRKSDSLDALIQLYAVAALCSLQAYEEAEDLLATMKRPARTEAYFAQYEWICGEGMRDREACLKALGKMEASLSFLKGNTKRKMQELFELFSDFTYMRYERVIAAAGRPDGLTERQAAFRQRLAEDAKNEIFGIEKGDV